MFLAVSDTFDPRRHPRRPDGTFAPAPPPSVPDSGLAADLADVLGGVDQVEARAGIDDPAIDHALAVQTEPPRPPDSDDDDAADWWYEHGKTWVKNTATPDDLERVVDDYWDDGHGVPEAIAQAVYRDDCPTGVVDAVLAQAHLPLGWSVDSPDHISFAVGEDTGRAARHPNRPGDWADSAARGLCTGDSFNDGFFNQFDSPDRQRGLRNPDDTAALLAALRHEGELGDEAVVDVASHPNTPPGTLARLADDSFWDEDVRQSVAANPSTPPDTLTLLAADPNEDVREAAATNPNTPPAGRSAAGLLND